MERQQIMRMLMGLGAGLMFGLGLGVAEMTRPSKVVGFLDITGSWDPSLAFVMVRAIGVNLLTWLLVGRLNGPVFAPRFQIPKRTDIDARLLGGAALFGLGWGLAGFCPGPALTAIPAGSGSVLLFVVAMLGGMGLFELAQRLRRPASTPTPAPAPAPTPTPTS